MPDDGEHDQVHEPERRQDREHRTALSTARRSIEERHEHQEQPDETEPDDAEVLDAFRLLSETEGIIPALESAHALAWVARAAGTDELPSGTTILVTLSGRGDKDVAQVRDLLAGS